MENASFTKGPWRAHQGWADPWISLDRNRHPNWCEITLDGDLNGREFLSISGHFGIANARLIAAAPDLYEALTLMLAPMPEHLDGCLWKNDRRMPCQCGQSDRLHTAQSVALGKARAALLKATGETK